MNTKLIMSLSAITMGILGISLSFLPQEIFQYLNPAQHTSIEILILQILGALYFSFALMNWTTKANLIGGIYARPIAIANLAHFTIGALALIKGYFANYEVVVLTLGIIYSIFAILFSLIFFSHPVQDKN
jgi:hypothetical protein